MESVGGECGKGEEVERVKREGVESEGEDQMDEE